MEQAMSFILGALRLLSRVMYASAFVVLFAHCWYSCCAKFYGVQSGEIIKLHGKGRMSVWRIVWKIKDENGEKHWFITPVWLTKVYYVDSVHDLDINKFTDKCDNNPTAWFHYWISKFTGDILLNRILGTQKDFVYDSKKHEVKLCLVSRVIKGTAEFVFFLAAIGFVLFGIAAGLTLL